MHSLMVSTLLQIAIKDDIYIVDTTLVDVKNLWEAIARSKAVKIIHSGSLSHSARVS